MLERKFRVNAVSRHWILSSRRRAWLCYGLVVALLLIAAMELVRQNLQNNLGVSHRAMQRTLNLLGLFVADVQQSKRYQSFNAAVRDWAVTDVGLVELQLVKSNGVVLTAYRSTTLPTRVLRLSAPINLSDGRATLSLARDLSPLYEQNSAFRNQLLVLVGVISGLLGMVWYLLIKRHEEAGVLLQKSVALNAASESLRASEQHLRTVIDTDPECVKLLDADGRVLEMNKAGLALIEADCLEQVLGQPISCLVLPEHRAAFQALNQTVLQGNKGMLVFEMQGFKGTRRWLETHAVPMSTRNGEVVLLGITRDISLQRRAEEQLDYLAHYDALTGLANRRLFVDRLNQSVIKAERHNRQIAVLFLDLDRFKNINDTLGHDAGDQLLKGVAVRLSDTVRRGDTLARQSGDEFTMVLTDLVQTDDVARVAQKIIEAFIPPFHIAGRDLFMTVSLGIALFPVDTRDPQLLLRYADIAMYRAKETGRSSYQFYAMEMTTHAFKRMELESALRIAIKHKKFELHYQPIVSGRVGDVVGVEALLRWESPEHGLVPPLQFIALAEETGLILPLSEWVLNTACAQLRQWHLAGFPELRMAVNLSARLFRENGLVRMVANAVNAAAIMPRHLEIEITESILAQESSASLLRRVSVTGVQFSIDDFGTGFSSLSYLRRFPIDTLKIDQSFVRDIPGNTDSAALAVAIIAMAHSLDIRVVAEGVETTEQHGFMQYHNCDEMQGYFFSKPLPAEDLTQLLAKTSPPLMHLENLSVGEGADKNA